MIFRQKGVRICLWGNNLTTMETVDDDHALFPNTLRLGQMKYILFPYMRH